MTLSDQRGIHLSQVDHPRPLVPTNTLGRLVGTVVMISGIGFLTVITATITSTFIEEARGRTAANTTDELAAKLDQIIERLDLITAAAAGDPSRHDRQPTD